MDSPRPDALRIRQTRDATVIRVLPYRSHRMRPWAAGGVVLLGYAVLRSLLPSGPVAWVLLGVAVVALGACGGWWWTALRRSEEILEVYVGRKELQLVWSQAGEEVRRRIVVLVGITDARLDGLGVALEGPEPLWVPMEAHSDEARRWMVEHLRGAAIGARRRAGL